MLLYGPPGTGKSSLCKYAIAKAKKLSSITGTPLTHSLIGAADMSKWVGESAKFIRSTFKNARRYDGVGIVVIDDADMIVSSRNDPTVSHSSKQVTAQLMHELSGVQSRADTNLLVLGTTNITSDLDPALLERFKKRIYVPLFTSLDCAVDFASNLIGLSPASEYLGSAAIKYSLSQRDVTNIVLSAKRSTLPGMDDDFFLKPADVRYRIRSSIDCVVSLDIIKKQVFEYVSALSL